MLTHSDDRADRRRITDVTDFVCYALFAQKWGVVCVCVCVYYVRVRS